MDIIVPDRMLTLMIIIPILVRLIVMVMAIIGLTIPVGVILLVGIHLLIMIQDGVMKILGLTPIRDDLLTSVGKTSPII